MLLQIVSYLGELTGLSKPILDQYGMKYSDAVTLVRRYLPKNAVLVGVNITKGSTIAALGTRYF